MSEPSSARARDSKSDDEQVSGALVHRASLPHLLGGRYRPLHVIGRGGMGVVYAAEHIRTGEHFALKVISTKGGVGATTIERFKREARLPAQIKSEHINRVIDADVAPEIGALFLVMELLEGSDFDRLSEGKPQLPRSVVDWFAQIARGLDRAHAIGIVHRDLKPENLFLTRREDGSELVKILDFGLAKLSFQGELGSNATETGNVVGTPRYMSPEQAMGDVSHIGPAADVWALGLCAFRLLTGRHYWPGTQVAQLIGQIVYGPMALPSACGADFGAAFDRWFQRSCDRNQHERWTVAIDRDPPIPLSSKVEVPRALERVVERCLAKSPEDRFTSCRDVLAELEALRPTASPRRWVVLVLAVVVAIGAVVVLASREKQSKAQDQPTPVARESTASPVRVDQSTPTAGSRADPAAGTPAAAAPPPKQSAQRPRTAPPRAVSANAPRATVTRDPLLDQK